MPDWLNTCCQTLGDDGQPRPCPCRYSHKCPDATLDCKMGRQWCYNCITGEDGKFLHTPAKNPAGIYFPCNTYTAISRDCNLCAFHLKHPFYSSILGEYRPFEEEVEDLPF